MSQYELRLSSSAERELESLDDGLFERIDAKILALVGEPRPAGAKKLKGRTNAWRIRVGDYRIIYSIDDKDGLLTVVRIAHRSRAY